MKISNKTLVVLMSTSLLALGCLGEIGFGDTETSTRKSAKPRARDTSLVRTTPDEATNQGPSVIPAAEVAVRDRLGGMMRGPGIKLSFIDCSSEPCLARVETRSLVALREVLTSVSSSYGGRISFTARQRLSAYTGQSFQADVVLGTDEVRVVPTNEAEILGQ
jgi:hypothetical protein